MLKQKMWVVVVVASFLLAAPAAWADDDAIMDVDNHSAAFVGNWGTSTAKILYYGDNYRYAWGCGDACTTPTRTATFTTKQTADISGYYNVYVRHTTATNREETARFNIYSVVGGTPNYRGACYINQTQDGGEWLFCANVYLPNGSYGRVVLGNENTATTEVVIADGVRFVRTGVDGGDILNGSITGADIATGAVASVDIADSTITGADIATGAVSSIDIADNSITGADILNSTITGTDIASSSIYDYDVADEAGVDYAGGDQHLILSTTDAIARTSVVTAPTSGYIIVTASGYWNYSTGTSAVPRCSITTGTVVDFSALTLGEVSPTVDYMPFATTRTYYVSASGSYTYNLVCDMSYGTAYVDDTYMNAIFVPTRY